jgi:hypothetical protein
VATGCHWALSTAILVVIFQVPFTQLHSMKLSSSLSPRPPLRIRIEFLSLVGGADQALCPTSTEPFPTDDIPVIPCVTRSCLYPSTLGERDNKNARLGYVSVRERAHVSVVAVFLARFSSRFITRGRVRNYAQVVVSASRRHDRSTSGNLAARAVHRGQPAGGAIPSL